MARLEEICSLITDGSHFSPEDEGIGYPMFSVKDMTPNGFNISGCKKIGEEAYKKLVANGCKPLNDDVVVAKDGSYLKTAFVIKGNPEITLLSSIAILRPKIDLVVPEYLSYFLKSDAVYRTVSLNYITGTALKRIILKGIRKIEVDLPDIGEQEQRAQRLSKVDYLCQLRKQQLAKLDELVKARFFEMFGEISGNSMNWDCFTIGKLISTIESGWSGNGKQREKHADEIAVLKVSAVTKGYFIPTECKVLDDQHNIKKYVYPQKGDILFSRANTKEMVGATVLIKKDYPDLILPDKLWKIRFCTDVNPIYMKHVLSTTTVRNAFSAASTGTSGSMYNVSMEKFKGVIIPVPPLSVQNEFAAFVERVDQQKQTAQQSLEKLELMKKALMQEYFG